MVDSRPQDVVSLAELMLRLREQDDRASLLFKQATQTHQVASLVADFVASLKRDRLADAEKPLEQLGEKLAELSADRKAQYLGELAEACKVLLKLTLAESASVSQLRKLAMQLGNLQFQRVPYELKLV